MAFSSTSPSTISVEVASAKSKLTASKKVSVTVTARGDVNGDGIVDAADYTAYAAEYGRSDCCDKTKAPCESDLNNDCTVDGLDYLVWQKAFSNTGCVCPP